MIKRNGTKITFFGSNGKPKEVIEVTGYKDKTVALMKQYSNNANALKLIADAEKEAVKQGIARTFGN